MGHKFLLYSLASLGLFFGIIVMTARAHRGQFFGTVVHLTNLPWFGIVATNAAMWCVMMVGKLVTRLFFGELTLLERQKGVERFFLCLTESVLAMAYLQYVGSSAIRLFVCSIFLRVFHSLARYRHETIEQSGQTLPSKTVRLTVLVLGLFIVDVLSVCHFGQLVAAEGIGMNLTFLLDYSLMAISAIGTLIKIYINQCSRAGAGGNAAAERYHATKFYVNVVLSVSASLLHIAFFGTLLMYTIPIHLIRDLIVNLSETASNCRHLLNYRRLTANIDRVLPDATAEQLEKNKECAICYEDMVEGTHCKALPCAHVFHRQCLLRWFEKQTACAYCGKDVKKLFQSGAAAAAAGNGNNRNRPAQPAAAVPAPAAAPGAAAAAAAAAVAAAPVAVAPVVPAPAVAVPAAIPATAPIAAAPAANAPAVDAPPALVAQTLYEPPNGVAYDVAPLDHGDLEALTEEELERELLRLVGPYQAAADRSIMLPPIAVAGGSGGGGVSAPPAAVAAATVAVSSSSAAVASPQPSHSVAAPLPLLEALASTSAAASVGGDHQRPCASQLEVAAKISRGGAEAAGAPSLGLLMRVAAYERYVEVHEAALLELRRALTVADSAMGERLPTAAGDVATA